jgi:hypothetical protein
MGILGGFNQQNLNQWIQGGLSTQYLNNLANYGGAMSSWWPMAGPMSGAGLGWSERADELRRASVANQDIMTRAMNPETLTQLYRDSGMFMTPEMQAAQLALGGTAGAFTPARNTALQGFMGGGWTPQYQQTFDRMAAMRDGQGWQMAQPANIGGELLSARGQTPESVAMRSAMTNALNTGGMNPYLWGGQQSAAGVLGNQGYTPGLAGLSQQGAQIMSEGGWDPYTAAAGAIGTEGLLRGGGTATTDALQAVGTNLAAREALMPMDKVISAAGDRAGNQAINQFQAAQRRAEARGGGPGAVRGGIQNAGMADYADQAARMVADAQNQAMMSQQGLQLQQRGMGQQMAQQAGQLEGSRLGTMSSILGGAEQARQGMYGYGASMMPQAESIAAQRMGQAYGAIPGMQQAGTAALNAYGGLGQGGMSNELARLGLGGNLLDQYNQTRLGAQGLFNQAMGQQNQYALGMGNLAQGMGGLQGDLYGQQFGNYLGGGQLGMNRASNIANAWTQGVNAQQGWNQLANQGFQAGMGAAQFPAQGLMDLARTWAGGAATNFNQQGMAAPWAYGN